MSELFFASIKSRVLIPFQTAKMEKVGSEARTKHSPDKKSSNSTEDYFSDYYEERGRNNGRQ